VQHLEPAVAQVDDIAFAEDLGQFGAGRTPGERVEVVRGQAVDQHIGQRIAGLLHLTRGGRPHLIRQE
jgi:hypothetical protein